MNEDAYATAREAKGTGSGTHIGYLISNFAQYQQLTVTFYDFYNNCNLDYYMVALGQNTQNVSGVSNLVTNSLFRLFSSGDTSLTDLADAVTAYTSDETDDNLELLGEAAGVLLINVLSVAIPTTSSDGTSYYQTASSFSRRR